MSPAKKPVKPEIIVDGKPVEKIEAVVETRISDNVWLAVIAAVVTLVPLVTNIILAARAAAKVEEVRVAREIADAETAARLSEIERVGGLTHELSNSAMLGQKKLLAEALRVIADRTKDPGDIRIAEKAEEIYEAHRKQQELMNRQAEAELKKKNP